jgi:MFS transporter, PPP family, 3-phenylpropionic acid transporter
MASTPAEPEAGPVPAPDPGSAPDLDAASEPAHAGSVTPSAIVYALQFTAVAVWVAYATVYFKDLGVDLAVIGVLAAVPSLVAIVAAPAWGMLADRLGDMRPPYLAGALWAASAALLLVLGPSMPWLALIVVAVAIGVSGLTPLVDARTVQRLGRDRHRFGQARVWGSISFVVSGVVVGAMLEVIGLRAVFTVYSAALVASAVAAYALLGRPERGLHVGGIGPRVALDLLRAPGMLLFFVGTVIAWTSNGMVLTLLSLRIVELGGANSLVGIGWAVNALLEIPMMLVVFPWLARRVRLERLIVAGIAVYGVRTLLWGVAVNPAAFVAVAAISGIGFTLLLVGTTTYVAARFPASLQGTAQALFGGTVSAIGYIAGAVLAGSIAQQAGIAMVYPIAAAGCAVGALTVWFAVARGRHEIEAVRA